MHEAPTMPRRRATTTLLLACAAITLLLLCWLGSLEREAFTTLVWTPDTFEYNRLALDMLASHSLALHLEDGASFTSGQRTLGYPLFLALGYLVGGRSAGLSVTVALQLLLNLLFTWGVWQTLQRLAPAAGLGLRALVTLFFFWAGVGMALALTSDFLAAFFFGGFLYGFLFCRSRAAVLLAGASVALATLTRPTFTLLPCVLPFAASLIGQFSAKVPRTHLLAFMGCSCLATGMSMLYQYTADGYIGPASVVTQNMERALYFAVNEPLFTETDYIDAFKREIERRAGQPFGTLSRRAQEQYAKAMFVEVVRAHPGRVLVYLGTNFVKYLCVPVEAGVRTITAVYVSDETYVTCLRPVLGLLCLPLWLLGLSPPLGGSKQQHRYYLLVAVLVVYVVGLSAITPLQGERMRFPVLAWMLPVMLWNIAGLRGAWRRIIRRDTRRQQETVTTL